MSGYRDLAHLDVVRGARHCRRGIVTVRDPRDGHVEPSDREWLARDGLHLHRLAGFGGIDHLAVAYIYADMARFSWRRPVLSWLEEEQVARLCLGKTGYWVSDLRFRDRAPRQLHAQLAEDVLHETGAVKAAR